MWKRLTSCFLRGSRENNRSGSPDKLTSVSSESEAPEHYVRQESNSTKTELEAKSNDGELFGQKSEGIQGIQNEENERNENLRLRLSAEKSKSQNGQDAEYGTKVDSSKQGNASNEFVSNGRAETKAKIEMPERNDNLEETCDSRRIEKQGPYVKIVTTCNVKISDNYSGQSKLDSFKSVEESHQAQFVEMKLELDNEENIDNIQEEARINNDIDSVNESLIDELSNSVEQEDVLVIEEPLKVSEAISIEAATELLENRSFSLEKQESLKEQESTITGDLSDNFNLDVNRNESSKPLGLGEISQAANDGVEHNVVEDAESCSPLDESAETVNESLKANLLASDDQNINEESPNHVVEKFSNRLSKCILDAVLRDTQLLFSRSEDENDESRTKESILKFSDILSKSIVKCVVDYAKVSQDHIAEHDEHDRLSPNVSGVASNQDKTYENTNQDLPFDPSPANEDEILSSDEAVDDHCAGNLHEYAKRLSQQILVDVFNLNRDSTRSSMDAYASKLTKCVLSNAINSAESQISDHNYLADSDLAVRNALDLFVSDIVRDAIDSAISRIGRETHKDIGECNGIESDVQVEHGESPLENHLHGEGDLGMFSGEGEAEHGGQLGDDIGHSGIHNGTTDNPNEQVENDDMEPEGINGPNPVAIQENGKLQSKWLNEDDLDELYDENLSDEEAAAADEGLKLGQNANDTNKLVLSANNLMSPSDEKQFWRKSLIEDLDDEMDFDEIVTPRSSVSSSPKKSGNFEDISVDGSVDSDDEVLETFTTVKVQAPVNKSTNASRSRLRSVDTTPVLVLDNGSDTLKVGFSDQAMPKEIVSSVVGTPLRYSQDISGMEYSARPGLVFGSEAIGKAGVLHIEYPLKSDLVEKWNDVEGLWNYVLGSLMGIQDNPDFPVLISQPALNPKKNSEKIAEIMFEHFHMPSLFIADQLVLSLFSMGYTSGLSFSSGFKSTQAGVIYEGHVLPHTVKQLDVAGYQLTENLKKLLMSRTGVSFRSSSQWQIVDDIKKKLGFFSLDFEEDSKRYKTQAELQTVYELPDGQVIEVGLERFGCTESLFRPMEVGLTQSPPHKLIIEAINSCEEELQELCYKAMGVSGGTTKMTGFIARLEQELQEHDRKVKNITAPEDRDLCTWLGGSVVASLPTFREMVVTIDEYAESGGRVVHSKCF